MRPLQNILAGNPVVEPNWF